MKSTQFRCDDELYLKVKYIAQQQERSWNAQACWILRQFVLDYERVNGKIDLTKIED